MGWASPLSLAFLKITSYRGGVRSLMLQAAPASLHLDKKLDLQLFVALLQSDCLYQQYIYA